MSSLLCVLLSRIDLAGLRDLTGLFRFIVRGRKGANAAKRIAASLARCPDLGVAVAARWAEARRWLADELPDLAIFDLTDGSESHSLLPLLKNLGLLTAGLDAERDRALVIAGREARPVTLDRTLEMDARR